MNELKNKEQLNQLSEQEVGQYKSEFLQSSLYNEQYKNELELYIELRFENNKKFLQDLIQKEIDGQLSTDDIQNRSQKLILNILKKDGLDVMNDGMLFYLKEKIGEPKYII